jgi:putative phage-type endonuclease
MAIAAEALPVIQGTPEWLDARLDRITASDLPILTGNSPYRSSPLDLWAHKTRRLTAEPPSPETQELWDLGHALEPVIADRYTLMRDRPLRRVRRMLQSRRIPWAAASLDRVSAVRGERLIVELKWVPWRRRVEGPEPVPAYVQDQVQWQLLVSGWPMAHVAVLNGSHVEVHEVAPHEAYQDALVVIAERFYRDNLIGGIPPKADGSEATRKALLRLYPTDDGTLMEATAELEALMREWREARPAAKEANEREDRIKNAIRLALGEHSGAEGKGWRVTHKRSKDSERVAWRAVAAAYRALLEEYDAQDERLDAIASLHSTTQEGSRTLVPRWTEEGETWT